MKKIIMLLSLSMLVSISSAYAEDAVGKVYKINGVATVERNAKTIFLNKGSDVYQGDVLVTQENSYLQVEMSDKGFISVLPNSRLGVKEYNVKNDDGNVVIHLVKGGLRSLTGLFGQKHKQRWQMNTSNATIGIRGTEFGAIQCADEVGGISSVCKELKPDLIKDGLYLDVNNGEIAVENQGGEVFIKAGEFGFVGSTTTSPTIIDGSKGFEIVIPGTAKTPFDPVDNNMMYPRGCK